jgi:hypothetical protein
MPFTLLSQIAAAVKSLSLACAQSSNPETFSEKKNAADILRSASKLCL